MRHRQLKRQHGLRFPDRAPKREGDNSQWHEFMALDLPHPYGVLPEGNRLLLRCEDSADTSSRSNDPFLRQIRDETWLVILGFCDGITLGKLVQTCRFFYVAGHEPELWRDLTLRKLNDVHGCPSIGAIEVMGDSWKDTYVLITTLRTSMDRPSKPMKIPGVYSDDLYRLHSCRAFAIPSSWLQEEPTNSDLTYSSTGYVPRVSAEEISCDDFVQKFENPNKPVVIQGAAKSWKAFRDWNDPAYLIRQTKGTTFRATSGAAPLPAKFTLPAFQKYCASPLLEESPLYLFDREALKQNSPLHCDFSSDLARTCPFFDPDLMGQDLFKVLGEGKRPDHTWLIIGGLRSGSVFHIDPNATHAWNAAIVGRKRWIFYPPHVTPPGVYPSKDGDEVALPLSIGEWLLTFWREHQDRKRTAKPSQRPLECTVFPGDVVFVPHGWWHMVVNLDQVNIAITHNYVSLSNLSNVLRFLNLKEDQISGCRDRAESIKPEHLHSAMVQALKKYYGEDTEWLVEAQKQAYDRWTCDAWKDDNSSKKRTLEYIEKVTGQAKEAKNHAHAGSSVLVKAKAIIPGPDDGPFSFSFM